jgi:hypothetical protein
MPIDTIPAMLTEGEQVVNNEAVDLLGADNIVNANKAGLAIRQQQNPLMTAFNASNASRDAAQQQFKAAVNPASLTGGAQGSVATINAPVAPQIQSAPSALPTGTQRIGNAYSQVGNSAADMSGIKSAIGSVTKPTSGGLNMSKPNNQAAITNMAARSNPTLANVQKAETNMAAIAPPAPAPMKQMSVSLGTNSQPQYFVNGTLDPRGVQEIINRTTGVDKAAGGGISRVMQAKEAFSKMPAPEAVAPATVVDPMAVKMTEAAAKPINIPARSITQTMGENVYRPPVGGWASEAGGVEGAALKEGAKKVIRGIGKYALKPIAGAGALAGIASTATEASPTEAAMQEKYGVEINPIKAKLRQGIQQGEDWAASKISQGAKALASRAANLFTPAANAQEPVSEPGLPVGAPLVGGAKVGSPEGFAAAEKANALPAPQNLGPVGTVPALIPEKTGPGAVQEQVPQSLAEVGAGQGMIVGPKGEKSVATKTGIYKYSPSGELLSTRKPDQAPTQSAKAQALGTTDFWVNRGYEGGQAQYLAEQKAKQGDARRQQLENIALNGGPTGDMSPSEFGRAKRQQATAQNLLQQLDAKEAAQAGLGMKQQELGINERRARASETANAVKEAAAEAREQRLEKQGTKANELAEKKYAQEVAKDEAEQDKPVSVINAKGDKVSIPLREFKAANRDVKRVQAGGQWAAISGNELRSGESPEAYRVRKAKALQKVFPPIDPKTGKELDLHFDEKHNIYSLNENGDFIPYLGD